MPLVTKRALPARIEQASDGSYYEMRTYPRGLNMNGGNRTWITVESINFVEFIVRKDV